jgi:hypothetical protein
MEMLVPAKIDDLGLTPHSFRVYAHLCRRASGARKCYPSVKSIARVCRINKDTVWKALKELEKIGLIKRTKGNRNSNLYLLFELSSVGLKEGVITLAETSGHDLEETKGELVAETKGSQLAESEGCKGYPKKDVPLRESKEGSEYQLGTLPEELTVNEFQRVCNRLKVSMEQVRPMYREFRRFKLPYKQDWDHLSRSDLAGYFCTWLETTKYGKQLLAMSAQVELKNLNPLKLTKDCARSVFE